MKLLKKTYSTILLVLVSSFFLLLFQNFIPSNQTKEDDIITDEVDTDDAVAPTVSGDENLNQGLCPTMNKGQLPLPINEIQKGGLVVLKKAHYYQVGELHLTSPVSIIGQGRGLTKITVCIGAKEAGMRIESKNVSIKGLSIELALKEKLMNSGSGEYGTGITIGRYFGRKELVAVSNVRIENIGISRGRLENGSRSFTGNAMVVVGNVSNVDIHDVLLSNSHSIGFLTHWGALLPGNCKYGHAYEIFDEAGEKLNCPVLKTFHPHNVKIDGLETSFLTNALIMISSSYNVQVNNVIGSAPMALQFMPGDEGVRYSSDEEKGLVGSNIKIENVQASIRGDFPSLPIVRIFSKGGSKWDQTVNEVHYKNVTVNNMELTTTTEERRNFRQRKYLFISKYGRGKNIQFNNLNFHDAGRARGYGFGAVLSYSKGITLSGFRSQAKNGVLVKNSEDIVIKNSIFNRKGEVATDPNRSPMAYSRGIIVKDETRHGMNRPFPGYANSISLLNNVITDYDYGMKIKSLNFSDIADICDRALVAADNIITALIEPFQGKECN